MPTHERTRYREIVAALAAGLMTDVFFALQQPAAGAVGPMTVPSMVPLGAALLKSGGGLIAALGVELWSAELGRSRTSKLNHELDAASGRAIASVIVARIPAKTRATTVDKAIKALARAVVEDHDPKLLSRVSGAPTLPLVAAELVGHPEGFIRPSLTADAWVHYLSELAATRKLGTALPRAAVTELGAALANEYPEAFYQELKKDLAEDGKAFGGAVLRQLDSALKQLHHVTIAQETHGATGEAVWSAVKALRRDLDVPRLHERLEQLSSSRQDLVLAAAALSNTVATLPGKLDNIERKLDRQEQLMHKVLASVQTGSFAKSHRAQDWDYFANLAFSYATLAMIVATERTDEPMYDRMLGTLMQAAASLGLEAKITQSERLSDQDKLTTLGITLQTALQEREWAESFSFIWRCYFLLLSTEPNESATQDNRDQAHAVQSVLRESAERSGLLDSFSATLIRSIAYETRDVERKRAMLDQFEAWVRDSAIRRELRIYLFKTMATEGPEREARGLPTDHEWVFSILNRCTSRIAKQYVRNEDEVVEALMEVLADWGSSPEGH